MKQLLCRDEAIALSRCSKHKYWGSCKTQRATWGLDSLLNASIVVPLQVLADDVLGSVPQILHLLVAVELVADVDDAVRVVEGSRLSGLVFVQQEADGCVGTLSGCADEGTVEEVGNGIQKRYVQAYDVRRDDAWVGCIHRDAFVLQAVGEVEGEERQCQLGVAVDRDTPEASPSEISGSDPA